MTDGLNKHGVKQVDRLLSNLEFGVWQLFALWVPHVIGDRAKVWVNLDWTEFGGDEQTTFVASMQTDHGRSTPLLWLTVDKAELTGRRNAFEDLLLNRLCEVLPPATKATVVADRGFGDHKLYDLLGRLGLGFVIRFRQDVTVTSAEGESRKAGEWLTGARPRVLRDASVTTEAAPVPVVAIVRAKDMKDAWCLVASDPNITGKELIQRYGRRFTIEEMFRDLKDPRFGRGLNWSRIADPTRRDQLLLLAALAQTLLEALGRAGEDCGFDRGLKTNTAKTRQLSLLRQGLQWFELIPNMPDDRLRTLMTAFDRTVRNIPVFVRALSLT